MSGYESKAERALRAVEERYADDDPSDFQANVSGGLDPLGANDRSGDFDAAEYERRARRGEL